jgi:SpoVK/Ycf46/Vps4 family AAA+-type ATPase
LIETLSKVARLLSPSIIFMIFFDEAKSLFIPRQEDDYGQADQRVKINQLLAEMEGFAKSETFPFVVLSTNSPGNLDAAVLRRVPKRIFLGLPSAKQ